MIFVLCVTKKELTNYTKDLLIDTLTRYKGFIEQKITKNSFESQIIKSKYLNQFESVKSLLGHLEKDSFIDLDIHGPLIKHAIGSTVYHNGVDAANFGTQIEGFEKEMFEKQKRYLDTFNEIFGYSGLEEFQKTMEEIRPYRL